MIKKSWIILALLLMLVFCVGSVSAADDVNDTVAIDENTESVDASIDEVDNDNFEASESGDILSSGEIEVNASDWSTLRTLCQKEDKNYKILLNGTEYNANDKIEFSSNVIIIGTDTSYITGGGGSSSTPFVNDYSDLSVIFLNVNFRDMNVENLMKLAGYNKFENCTFTNIVASSNTNNVLWNNGGLMEITGCNFTDCTTGRGVVSNYNSASSTNAQMIVDSCNFNGNYARSYAGAINNRGILNISNSNFVNNAANSWAGAVNGVANTETYIKNSKFKDNFAGWNGGAIYTYCLLEIYNSTFEGNNCTTNNGGGAIGAYNFVSTYNITIEGCNFTNNINLCKAFDNLSTTSLGRGGAISVLNGGYLDVHNSRFVNNYARIGQAIAGATYNYVNGSGGIPHIKIYNNQFINHTGNNDTVYITGNDVIFTNNTFNNSVQTILYSQINGGNQNLPYSSESLLGDSEEILSAGEDIYYVNIDNGDDFNNGKTPETAFETLLGALNYVNDGSIIYVADGTYTRRNPTDYSGGGNLTIIGQGNNVYISNMRLSTDNTINYTYTFININFGDVNNKKVNDFGRNANFINCTFFGTFTIGKYLSTQDQSLSTASGKMYTRNTTFDNCIFKDVTGDNFITAYKCANVVFNNCNFTNVNVDSLIYRPSFDNLYYDEVNWEWKVIENQSGTCYFDEDGLVLNNCSFLGCSFNGVVDSAADFSDVVEITGCKYDNAVTPGVSAVDNHNYINSTDLLPSTLTVSVGDIIYGNNFTINVKLDVQVTDIVYVTINKKEYSVNVVNGSGSLNVSDILDAKLYDVVAVFEGTPLYDESNATSNFTVSPIATKLVASNVEMEYGADAKTMTIEATNITDGSVISVKVNNETVNGNVNNGKAVIAMPANLTAKTYEAIITFDGDVNHAPASATANVSVSKATPKLSASNVAMVYNSGAKTMTVQATDLADGSVISVKVNGKTLTGAVKNGKAVIAMPVNLAAKTYPATITFGGDDNYNPASATAKVIVSKATPKLTAKKATFKANKKTKKYSIVLKDNKNKALGKVKVTLKVKGKTYKATTNAKGKATFKITKLTKKGTHKAAVKFAGNANFKAASKTVNIKVKK